MNLLFSLCCFCLFRNSLRLFNRCLSRFRICFFIRCHLRHGRRFFCRSRIGHFRRARRWFRFRSRHGRRYMNFSGFRCRRFCIFLKEFYSGLRRRLFIFGIFRVDRNIASQHCCYDHQSGKQSCCLLHSTALHFLSCCVPAMSAKNRHLSEAFMLSVGRIHDHILIRNAP